MAPENVIHRGRKCFLHIVHLCKQIYKEVVKCEKTCITSDFILDWSYGHL